MIGSGEYIGRDAALDAVFGQFCASSDETEAALNSAVEDIKRIPAADVRPVVRARWNTIKYPLYECSNCGAVYQDVGYGFNFCPNCGADMRGEQNGH